MRKLYFAMPDGSDASIVGDVMGKFGYRIPGEKRVVLQSGPGRHLVRDSDIGECRKIAQELGVDLLVSKTRVTFKSAV